MSKFTSILRKPDFVYGMTEETPLRFEEKVQDVCPIKYDLEFTGKSVKVIVHPSGSPVKYLKLRYSGDFRGVEKVYGDNWERCGLNAYIEWRSVMAGRVLPWFCFLLRDNEMACYGVKTGGDAFSYFQVDAHGITLFINLCSGNEGADIKESITACEIVELFEDASEPYVTAHKFAKMMCDNPVLPKEPIMGFNNWYWAYGDISFESVLAETDMLLEYTKGCKHKPYMIIDDGWQEYRVIEGSTNGGPWLPNHKFGDMKKMSDAIHAKGAKSGIWFRPLLTHEQVPEEVLFMNCNNNLVMDPSHPYTLKKVYEDTKRIADWGFDLIKHDFTTIDGFGQQWLTADRQDFQLVAPNIKYYDKTKTTAMIYKNLYKLIQDAAGDAEVIGCNAVGHLVAGIHSVYRTGNDTSGTAWEWSRRDGVNSLVRTFLNNAFYNADPDCAPFTEKVDVDINLDYLEVCALTGMTTLASVTPNFLNEKQIKRMNAIFRMADEDKHRYIIKDFANNANPEIFASPDGKDVKEFDWTRVYNGARSALDWME